jgi:transposase
MSRVELFERIRREYRDEGASIRGLAERHHVHRRTVRQALASAVPPARKTPERAALVLGGHEAVIRQWLTADASAPRKQRHTARRVWQRLRDEHGAQVAESTVRAFVAEVKAELAGHADGVTVAQEHAPGQEAEVDFGEFQAWVDGVVVRLWLFVLRLSHSGQGFAVAFAHQAQEAFFEGHVLAFAQLGGVPAGRIRYDNLSRPSRGSCWAVTGWRPSGSSRYAATTGSTRSSASRASRARTRRAGWRARSADSAVPTWSRCPGPGRWPSSTP